MAFTVLSVSIGLVITWAILYAMAKKSNLAHSTIYFARLLVSKLEQRLLQTKCRHPPRVEIIKSLKAPFPYGEQTPKMFETDV